MNELPENWIIATLGQCVEIRSGKSPTEYNLGKEGKYPYVKVDDLNLVTKYQDSSRLYTDDEDSPIPPYSVIFPKRGAAIMGNKVRLTIMPIYLDTNMMSLQAKTNLLLHEYLYYLLVNERLYKIADTSTIPQINNKHIEPYIIHLPPLAEQRQIAEILSTWDEAITLTEQLIAALGRRKQALMQVLLKGYKALPDNWRWGQLDEFLTQNREYITELEDKLYPRISVKWWAKGAVVDGYDNGLEVKMNRHQLARAGQIIVSEIWAKHGSIGIIPDDGEGALITSHFFLYDFKPNAEIEQSYIYELVDANYFMTQADKMSKGTTGYASLRSSDFLKFRFPVPPPQKQIFISDLLRTNDELLHIYELHSSRLQRQKRGLMQQLLTGAVRVGV